MTSMPAFKPRYLFPGLDIQVAAAPAAPVLVLKLNGEIGTQSLDGFYKCLEELLAGGHQRLLLDFGQVRFMGSGGFGALLLLKSQTSAHGGWLKICGLPSYLSKVMAALGFERFFKPYASDADALDDPEDAAGPDRAGAGREN